MTIQHLKVPFHSEQVLLFDVDGEPFVPVRPLAERFGIAWKPQFVKLQANPKRYGVTIMVTPSAGGPQESTCIPLRKLPAWLYSIHPNKVEPSVRDALIQYQAECDDVLWQHWNGQRGQETVTLRRHNTALRAMALASNPLLNRIRTLAEAGYTKRSVRVMIGKSFDAADALFEMLEESGLLPDGWPETLDRSLERASAAQAELFTEESHG